MTSSSTGTPSGVGPLVPGDRMMVKVQGVGALSNPCVGIGRKSMSDPLARLQDLERLAELGGGEERLARQHAAGKLVARERMELLFDPGTFEEVDKLVTHRCLDFGMESQMVPGDRVVTGHARIDGRVAYAFAQDFTVFGGSLSETNAAKAGLGVAKCR